MRRSLSSQTLKIVSCTILLLIMLFSIIQFGCSNSSFLGLQDYQREGLFGFIAYHLLLNNSDMYTGPQGEPGQNGVNGIDGTNGVDGTDGTNGENGVDGTNGLNCWDLNNNFIKDAEEDTNNDGVVDVLDCRGQDGLDGANGTDGRNGNSGNDGSNGQPCWDLNNNGVPDCLSDLCLEQNKEYSTQFKRLVYNKVLNEDINNDGVVDVLDCRGSSCSVSQEENGINVECTDGSSVFIENPNDGLNCWDLNGNGVKDFHFNKPQLCSFLPSQLVCDPETLTEDTNNDGVIDVRDCRGQNGEDGEDGEDGTNCIIEDIDNGVQICCGQSCETINDGGSCSVRRLHNGKTKIECDDGSTAIIKNGLNCWDLNGNGVKDFSNPYWNQTSGSNFPNLCSILPFFPSCQPTQYTEDKNNDGVINALDCQGKQGVSCTVTQKEGYSLLSCDDGTETVIRDGANGSDGKDGIDGVDGQDGKDGTLFFSVFTEQFWKSGINRLGQLELDNTSIQGPQIGSRGHRNGSVGWRVAVPSLFALNPNSELTLRLFLLNNQEHCYDNEGCLDIQILGKFLRNGHTIQNMGDARDVVIDPVCSEQLRVVDLPLGLECGDGLGWQQLQQGDLLAFEIQTKCASSLYTVLGVELFSSDTPSLSGSHINCNNEECDYICNNDN